MKNWFLSKPFWLSALWGALLLVCISWINMFPLHFVVLARPLCFFALTLYCLAKYTKTQGVGIWAIAFGVFLGSLLPELPVHVLDYRGSAGTMILIPYTLVGVVLAGLCFKEQRTLVYAMSMAIMLLLCTYVFDAYVHAMADRGVNVF